MKRYLTWLGILAVTAFVSMGTIVTPEVVLVDPTADLQDAVDNLDATAGGEIRLGPGTYQLSSTLRLDRPVILRGSGPYTKIVGADPDSDVVLVTSSYVSLRDLQLMGQEETLAAEAGDGIGLHIRADNSIIFDLIVERVTIANTGSWGVKLCGQGSLESPDSSTYDTASPRFHRMTVYNARSGGALYSGVGVSAPTFEDCNFVGAGFTPDSTDSWKWHDVILCYLELDPLLTLPRGMVYLFSTTDAVFSRCYFQPQDIGSMDGDTPALSLEDCMATQLRNCYFEDLNGGAGSAYFVTMSASSQFIFRDTYVMRNGDVALKFLHTNANTESACDGVIDGMYALNGATSTAKDTSDFFFNAGSAIAGDGSGRERIVLSNIQILNTTGRGLRDVSVRQTGGTSAFPWQNILLQNTSHRFAVPKMGWGVNMTMGERKAGEMSFVTDTLYTGSFGSLMAVGTNYSANRIPFCPIYADTATRGANYTAPREGDMVYIGGTVHKLQVWDGTAWRDLH